jgi:hypothetical protein
MRVYLLMKRVRCRINIGKGYQMSATIVCRLEIGDKVIVGEQFSKNRSPAICLIELEDKRELAAASTPQIERMHEMLQLRSHQQAFLESGQGGHFLSTQRQDNDRSSSGEGGRDSRGGPDHILLEHRQGPIIRK